MARGLIYLLGVKGFDCGVVLLHKQWTKTIVMKEEIRSAEKSVLIATEIVQSCVAILEHS